VSDKTKLYILSNGFIENDIALNILLHNQATVDDPHKGADWHRVPSISLLIEHPKLGWVLVDTGSHRDAMTSRWPERTRQVSPLIRTEADLLENRLAEMGLKPSDIYLLLLTHLHIDHAGGLDNFCHTPAGQHVVVHELELKQALFDLYVHNEELANGYLRSDFVGLPGISFDTFEGESLALADDLELIWLPGHTAGHYGVKLQLENTGTVIYVCDAANNRTNYGPPARLSAILYNSDQFLRSIERVRWMERRYNATILFGHDLAQYNTLRLAPQCYD
jgi:glyoxylase-like metal-dependent hydrolase (beta-lactamase superfamily II)